MLFAHGFPDFWYTWRHQMVEFSRDYFVVAVDLPGYNASEQPTDFSAYQKDNLCSILAGTITALGYDKCVLVGHDWGGNLSWSIAADPRYSSLVQYLVIMNMAYPAIFIKNIMTNPDQLIRSWYIFFFQLPFIPEWLINRLFERNIYRLRDEFQNPNQLTSQDFQAMREAELRGGPGWLTAAMNYYRNVPTPHLFFELFSEFFNRILQRKSQVKKSPVIQVPTLVIWGLQDNYFTPTSLDGTEEYVAELSIFKIDKASHWVQQDQPEQVNQAMRQWLQKQLKQS